MILRIALPLALMSSLVNAQDVERRIDALLSRMTLEEKLGQMSQSTSMRTPISEPIRDEIRKGRWGSFLNAGSPADRAEAQRIALKESRLGIPLVFGRDVIHGYHTIFPIPLGQSASWDPELIRDAARIAAREAAGEGIQWTFAPMIDIARDPRWGRVAETLGEDPYLTSALGAAMVRGFQGGSLASPDAVAACAKHYVGYGAAEGGRDYNSTWIPEILLRQVYLPSFRAARDAGVATFMTSFNALNGVPATGNRFTLRQVLRDEWKYDGMVVSDYTAVTEMIPHGYAADNADAAREAALAGVDMEMVSTTYFDHMKALIQSKQVDAKLIDDAVRNILRLKFRLGLFDNRPQPAAETRPVAEALDTARRLAVESVVLLKNEGNLLPISASIGKVAVIGPLADSPTDQMGTWVMDGRAQDVQTPLAALRRMLGPDRLVYARALRNSRDNTHDGFAAAADAARNADLALLFLGEEQILSGEAHSRAFLTLPGAQEALVEEIAKAGKPIVAVILAGRPLTFQGASSRAGAVLYAWHPGTMGGPAIADLLFGRAAPSGKLTITFPRTVGQVPIYYSHLNTGRPPSPGELGIPMGNPVEPKGYTSKYLDVDFTPEYPFGYGLSYTAFEYSNLRLSGATLRSGGTLTVSADVANTGTREADEVAQFYIRDLVASVVQPVRALKGFRRVHLKPGEKQTVQFTLTANDLAFYNEQAKLVTEPGRFQVWVAPDSARGVPGEFTLE
ncbi:MAG: glycoside hydrolase family 3 C-terminal domain-containing protein [Acidobacteriia bacterium]|nr:glycoside hydrolase family 3 C-terminal domain-containing protein [Terriglobia bacterium]